MIDQQKKARLTLHWRAHLSIEAKFDSEHFQFSMQKLGISTEEEFLSETKIGFYPHQNRSLETWIKKFGWVKLWESQTLVWPQARKTLSTKTANFWYIRYIPILAKAQELKIAYPEYQVQMKAVTKFQPHVHYILGDMIPPM